MPAGSAPGARRRVRGRTTLIVACAALLGVVGGLTVGYSIQADRPPTRLAPLARSGLAYPAKPLAEGEGRGPLSVGEDHALRTAGDLRKVLVPRPRGARDISLSAPGGGTTSEERWLSPSRYAAEFKGDGHVFTFLMNAGVRRIAAVDWEENGHHIVDVRLVQFRAGGNTGAIEHAEGQLSYMPDDDGGSGDSGDALKGSGNGRYFLYPVHNEPGYVPQYEARAIAYRGDVMMDVVMWDTRPISAKAIRTLAERQLERL